MHFYVDARLMQTPSRNGVEARRVLIEVSNGEIVSVEPSPSRPFISPDGSPVHHLGLSLIHI